jgi:hypothetical protein
MNGAAVLLNFKRVPELQTLARFNLFSGVDVCDFTANGPYW